jgi:putative tricarboxylic transport membrane protein
MVDVLLMMAFGGVGYLIRKFDYEPAPLLLAFVLGRLLEKSIRQSLIVSQGSLLVFLNRPISRVFTVALILIILLPMLTRFFKRLRFVSVLKQAGKSAAEGD